MIQHPLTPWLILHFAAGLGTRRTQTLLQHFESIQALTQASRSKLETLNLPKESIQQLKNPNWKRIEATLRWAESDHHHILHQEDSQYPHALKTIHDPPVLLYIRGNISTLQMNQLAIVGSRKASHGGVKIALTLASQLAQKSICITSGMALGIDTAAHQGALKADGNTIAILAHGLDQIYPKRNQTLSEQILASGCLVSEFPLGTSPKPLHFPQRNRIVSGMSRGTIIVEARLKSGSLITADYALEQGRDVFAVPGSILNPGSEGPHKLIKLGAKLVETVEDILSEFPDLGTLTNKDAKKSETHQTKGLEKESRMLLECVDFQRTTMDELLSRSGLSIAEITRRLIQLELDGFIYKAPGGYEKLRIK